MIPTATNVAIVDDPALATALSGWVAVVLIVLLVGRELAAAAGPRFEALVRNLTVGIAPLLVVFSIIVLTRLGGLR